MNAPRSRSVSKTTVCPTCGNRFSRGLHSNQYKGAAGEVVASTTYCSPACRQAAYRLRKDIRCEIPASARPRRPTKRKLQPRSDVAGGTDAHASVTRADFPQDIQGPATAKNKTTHPLSRRQLIEIEVFAPHCWSPGISSGGVPYELARLRKSVLVRRRP